MATFRIPDTGILLDCNPRTMDTLPQQSFAITLNDSVIEDMIKCVQDGQEIELALGNNPSFIIGSTYEPLTQTPEPFHFDLFVTRPNESARKASKFPNPTTSILKATNIIKGPTRVEKMPAEKNGRSAGAKSGPKTAANKLLTSKATLNNSASRSLPTSPALSGIGSPIINPTLSASQQAVSRAKEQRFPIVHELAVREQTYDYLLKKWSGNQEDFKTALEKAADFITSSQTWALKKQMWKELDVYKYDYESADDRRAAIDNAIKQYDRMRMSASDPEWQKLLPFEERGQGKCLSKLQATIAKGPAPKIKVQKTDGSSQESGTEDLKAEPMARSSSQPLPKSTSKLSSILGGKKTAPKPTTTKTTTTKTTAVKTTKTKAVPKEKPAPKAGGGTRVGAKSRVLSAAYVTNSDDEASEDEPLSNTVKPKPLPLSVFSEKPAAPLPKPRSSLPPKPHLAAIGGSKRARDDDDSSSSSGTPLSKRLKQPIKDPKESKDPSVIRAPIHKATGATTIAKKQHRASDASTNSRTTSLGSAPKVKSTSPAKSSPLASSPPTNASDLDEGETPPPQPPRRLQGHSRVASISSTAGKRRRMDDDGDRVKSKKARVPNDVMQMAARFMRFYREYENLHHELANLDRPPEDQLVRLYDMRERLQDMKKQIYDGVKDGPSD